MDIQIGIIMLAFCKHSDISTFKLISIVNLD